MNRPPNPHRDQTGMVGTLILVWLLVAGLIGVTVLDAGSIALTKFRLADVASSASIRAANVFRANPNVDAACQSAAASVVADDALAKVTKHGCVVNAQTGFVTITVRKQAHTILAGRLQFTKRFAKVSATESNGPNTL